MRIAIVIDTLERGGAERQALYAARELTRRGCGVELIHYYPRAETDYEISLAGDARVTCLPKAGRSVRFVGALRQRLRQGRFDVVHSYKGSACLYGGAAGWLAGIPVIIGGYRGGEYVESGPVRVGHRLLNRFQTAWVVNSPAIVGELVRKVHADPARCFVVRNGIDPAAFQSPLPKPEAKHRLGLDPGWGVVTMVALLRREKNHAMLVEAAARVCRLHPEARFLIVGDGPERPAIEARAQALGVRDRLRLVGIRSDVPELLAASDVSVLTSDYEGLSNSLMESMCASVPVVSTSYPGAADLITDGHDGYLVGQGDVEGLADRIGKLLADPDERQRLGRNALRTIETRYSIDAMVDGLLEVYEQLRGRVEDRVS